MPTIPANNNTGLYNTTGNTVPTDGNITTNNISATGNVTVDGYIIADGSITTLANFVGNLVGNVTGNVTLSGGNREVVFNNSGVTGSSNNFTFNTATNILDVNGNIDATYFIGNGSQLTGLPANYGNANVVTLMASFGSNTVSTTGNVTAGFLLGNGSQLTGLPATYGNANVTAFLPTYTGNLNPNTISASGNITGLNLKTSGAGGNITGADYVVASFFSGDGSLLTNLPGGGSVTQVQGAGAVSGLSLTGNVTTSGNLTLGGTLSLASVTGNISTTGNVTGGYIFGNGSQLTGIAAGSGTVTNVQGAGAVSGLSLTGNVTTTGNLTLGGTLSLATVTGDISTTGNVTGGYILGNGSQLTGIVSSYGNANVVANLAALGSNPVSTTGNVTAGYFIGNGTALGSITGANVTGTVSSATTATTAGTVTTAAQANITSVGTLTSLAVAGNVVTGVVQATNSAGLALKNSAGTTQAIMGAGGGDNFAINVSTNLNGVNAQIDISPTGTGHVHIKPTGTGAVEIAPTNPGTINNMVIGNATPLAANFTTVSTTGNVTASGNVSGGNVSAVGNIAASYFIGNGSQLTGITAGGSGTVTSVQGAGVVSGLSLTGNVTTSGNLTLGGTLSLATVTGDISTTGNITGGYIFGNGSQLTGIAATYGNANVVANLAALGSNPVSTTGNVTAGYFIGNGSALASITGANVDGAVPSATTAGTVTTAAQANITSVGVLTSLSSTGNITGANLVATGNVYAGSLQSVWVGTAQLLNNSGSPPEMIIYAATAVSGSLSATGNITGGNVTAAGNISASYFLGNGSQLTGVSALSGNLTGNITGGNTYGITDLANLAVANSRSIFVGSVELNNNGVSPASLNIVAGEVGMSKLVVSGNITGGNVLTGGVVSATGNITGSYILGNGSQLTGLTATAPAGSNTQIQYNNAGAFGGAAVFAFNNSTGNVTAGNIVIQANTTTTGSAQNIYTNSNQYLGNTATTPVLGRLLFGSGLSNVAGGSGDFSNNVDISSNMRGARMILTDRFQKTDTGIRSRSFTISNMVDISGNIGTANANSRIGSFVSEQYIGGGNSVSTNPAIITNQTASLNLGTNGNATVGNTAVTAATAHLAFVDLRPNSSLTSLLGYNPSYTNSTGNATAWTNAYGISPTTGGNAAIANFSLVHMQNASGLGWGVSSTVPPTNYYFLNNTDVRSESIVGPIRQYQDKTYLEATGTGTVAVDWDNGTSQVINLTGTMTLTFQDPTVGTTNQRLIHTVTLVIYQDGTGRAVTLPTASSTYRYAGGTSTVGTTANSVTMITISAIRVSGATQYLITVSPEFTG